MSNLTSKEIVFGSSFVKRFSKAVTFSEAVDQLSVNLLNQNLVTADYPQAVKDREKKYPTGLPTSPIGVAIPHTDPQFVKKNAVSVGVLEEPIEMVVMGTSDEPVSVSIIFLLSLAQSNKQLNILKRIMSVVQDQNELRRIISATNEEIAIDVQKAILEGLE